MQASEEDIQRYKARYLDFTFKNVLKEALFMFLILIVTTFLSNQEVTWWKLIVFCLLSSVVYSIATIALYRYLFKRGKFYVHPSAMYSFSRWKKKDKSPTSAESTKN